MRSLSTTSLEAGFARRRHGAGFTLVSVIFVLVVLALLGSALARLSVRQHLGSAAELEHARALQAARAGMEWALFQVLRNPPAPAAAPACFADTAMALQGLNGFTVSVRCSRTDAVDGATALAFFQLVATACNVQGAGCPASGTPAATYVERRLVSTVVR